MICPKCGDWYVGEILEKLEWIGDGQCRHMLNCRFCGEIQSGPEIRSRGAMKLARGDLVEIVGFCRYSGMTRTTGGMLFRLDEYPYELDAYVGCEDKDRSGDLDGKLYAYRSARVGFYLTDHVGLRELAMSYVR